ncbi:MAG: pentapeptide repeat-containing protein [SAR324 cluster bacterium]|nr:pentapeptide repeat-containing protein [SAR324 cluster bacterium]
MKKLISIPLLFSIAFLFFTHTSQAQSEEKELFSTRNKAGVRNGPRAFATFTLQQPTTITRINTYHWNDGKGTPSPGMIGIQGQGSWQAKGSPGMNGTPNAEWWAFPNLTLQPGTYTLTDSDSVTWSQNGQSNGIGHFSIYGIVQSVSMPSPSPAADSSGASEQEIHSTRNKAGVQNGPRQFATFTLQQPMLITRINTYHWNNGKGTPSPGKIGIQGQGSWQAKGSPGMNGTPNAEWWASPNITLQPGTYTVTDSDSVTWSQNAGSGGVGHFSIYGKIITAAATSANVSGEWDFGSKLLLKQEGNRITGTYNNGRSRIEGILNGRVWSGTFNYNAQVHGTFSYTFSPDFNSFEGVWANSTDSNKGTDKGVRLSSAAPSQTAQSGPTSSSMGNPSIRLQKQTFTVGEPVVVTYENLPGNSQDWVSVTAASKPDNQYDKWTYTQGKKNGTFEVSDLPPGSYQARLYLNWPAGQYNVQGRVSFEITAQAPAPQAGPSMASLRLDKSAFMPNEEIRVYFTASSNYAANAWVGIIPSSVAHGSEAENDKYDLSYQYLEKRSSGTLTFKAPAQNGSYDFRMNDADGGGREVASFTFSVGAMSQTAAAPAQPVGAAVQGSLSNSVSAAVAQFTMTPNAAISGYNNQHLTGVSPSDCAQQCLQNSWCQSFDYYKNESKCDLSDKNAAQVGGLKTNYGGNPYDHYAKVQGSGPVLTETAMPPFAVIAGSWDSSEGKMQVYQNGNNVSGIYGSDNGKISGILSGNTLSGLWTENSSSKKCATARNGSYYWGQIRFTFQNPQQFNGVWGYCNEPLSGTNWTGNKTASSPTAASIQPTAPQQDVQPYKVQLPPAASGESIVFYSRNIASVQNGPSQYATFAIQQPMMITRINTYHWNNGKGTARPGSIGIKGLGSWQAQGSPGMYNTPNAEWWVSPNLLLQPGTYSIVDSNPATWSQNPGSQGIGHTAVYGKTVSTPQAIATAPKKTFDANVQQSTQKVVVPQPAAIKAQPAPPAQAATETAACSPKAGADLRHCNFAGKKLDGADFSNTDLSGVSFKKASLKKAKFEGAQCEKTDFSHSNLEKASFKKAGCEGADFTKAKLEKANFRNANLSNTKFRKADVNKTSFKGAKLRGSDVRSDPMNLIKAKF